MLELYVLASGSSGNASIVRESRTGRTLLVDCGITKRDFMARCEAVGVDPRSIEAILITHEHTDHTKGLGVVLRGLAKLGAAPPLFAHPAVREASRAIQETAGLVEQCELRAGRQLDFDGLAVEPFETSHDAAASFGFRFDGPDDALGYMTDTGIVTGGAHEALQGVRILAIEGNHDPQMLRTGPYPYALKQRIAGPRGHLSNVQCAEEAASLLHPGLEHIVAMHISENNNEFDLPVKALRAMLEQNGHAAEVRSALPRTPVVTR